VVTNNIANIKTGASGTILQGQGIGIDPEFTTATYPTSTTINQILCSSANNVVSQIATDIDGVMITSHTGVPSILANGTATHVLTANLGAPPSWQAAGAGGGVSSVSGTSNRITSSGGATPVIDISSSYVGQSSITTLGTVATGTWNATKLSEAYGGTNQTTYATGDLLYASSSNTLAKLAIGSSTNVLTVTGGVPVWAAAGGGGGGMTWTNVTSSPQAFSVSNGYVANLGTLLTFTLPTTASIGAQIDLVGVGAGGWKITYTTSQFIVFGNLTSTVTSGYISSNNANDCVSLICTTTNNGWTVRGSVGNITVS